MADRKEVIAEIERLPWQQREAVYEAVIYGRAVDDTELAALAAAHAEATRRQLARIHLWIVVPAGAVAAGAAFWLQARQGADIGAGTVLCAGAAVLTLLWLLLWAFNLRPLTRARQANLHAAGLTNTGPPSREVSHWVGAWFTAWPVAALVGAGLRAAGLDIGGPLAFAAWIATLWLVKRALDSRLDPSS